MLLLFKCLELIDEQGGHFSGHRFFAGPNGQAEHLHEKNHRRISLVLLQDQFIPSLQWICLPVLGDSAPIATNSRPADLEYE